MTRHLRVRFPWKGRSQASRRRVVVVEALEGRQVLSTFTVTSLANAGPGSLRQAIAMANQSPGPDQIDFGVAGTIRVRGAALPAITDRVTINGASAPEYVNAPQVTVDFNGTRGLCFLRGSDGSTLRGLSIVRAASAGVTLAASNVTVEGNYIGLLANGATAAGNRGDGVRILASSHGNLIGHVNPVTGVRYYDAASVSLQPVSGWQGIRAGDSSGQYLITGTSSANGLLYIGPISGANGTSYAVNYPGATSTSVYGPDNLGHGVVRLVGSYRNGDGVVHGFLFEGTTADLGTAANYRTIDDPGATYNYMHSTMGGLVVGNSDGPEGNLPIGTGHALMYDIASATLLPDIVYPGSLSTTAYGIWHNGGTSYTIAGGFSRLLGDGRTISQGYLVDYDRSTGQFTHWTALDGPTGLVGQDIATHLEGISRDADGVYTLSADTLQTGSPHPGQGALVAVRRNPDGSFGTPYWVGLAYPGADARTSITSANSVAGNQLVGIVIGSAGTFSYQATVNLGFQLSNVISGNGGNGIGVYGSHDNRIAMNFIGTDATGTQRRGNGQNGVLMTQGAARNQLGGSVTGGNDPTAGVFVRPPQGNLISGNQANGVSLTGGATQNVLSGNFVGTTASGNAALGNRLDGVAIDKADGNRLIGCTVNQSPFVYYNVLSGNGRIGLRITDSNDTTVHANFLGVGADNATLVANGEDGLLVSGTSRGTQVGGVIPLGNVISGNNRHGIEVRDRASGFTSFNTFAGTFAFGGAAPNRGDGILITSSGGENLIRTSIVSGNLGHGIELGGQATGVQVTDTAVGTNSDIQTAIPNQGDGIRITGNAHGNAIGGFQPSVEPEVTVSANLGYGIRVTGNARENRIVHTFIGTKAQGFGNLGNRLGGVLLDAGTRGTMLGGSAIPLRNRIANSGGNGVSLRSSRGNAIAGNQILDNQGYGLQATGVCTGSVVRDNQIAANGQGRISLANSTGVVVIGPNESS